MMLGVAGAMLVATFGALRALRARADVRSAAATVVVERLATLARRPCASGDTTGTDRVGRTVSRWGAARAGDAWAFAETTAAPGARPLVVGGRVACLP